MWPIFNVFIEFATVLLLFYVYVFGMWDLSSPTKDQTRTPYVGRRSLNPSVLTWVPGLNFLKSYFI